MSFLFGSLNMIINYGGGYVDTFRMMRWSMGGIQAVGFSSVIATFMPMAAIFLLAFVTAPELNLFICGEEIASSRGVSVARLRKLVADARHEALAKRPPRFFRELLRLVRQLLPEPVETHPAIGGDSPED